MVERDDPVASTTDRTGVIRGAPLLRALLIGWALVAAAIAALGVDGPLALLVLTPFCLFGVGLALRSVLPGPMAIADTLMVVIGVGLASATVVAQALLVIGLYHPGTVVGIQALVVVGVVLLQTARRRAVVLRAGGR